MLVVQVIDFMGAEGCFTFDDPIDFMADERV